jgi:hypothetical protein
MAEAGFVQDFRNPALKDRAKSFSGFFALRFSAVNRR